MFLLNKESDELAAGVIHVKDESPSDHDPYQYQMGFGNHHVSEAIPGALPRGGTNMPQKSSCGLFPEHLNGTSFISSRESVSNVWMYRVKPAVVHRPLVPTSSLGKIEACFLPTNSNVSYTPLSHTWGPLVSKDDHSTITPGALPGVNFVAGLKSMAGHGDAAAKEGLAVHQYAFDTDMGHEAFVNNDGDMLLVPQRGALSLQTELGYLHVRQGDIAVVPAGIRFAVRSAKPNTARYATGYALEVFGTHFALPELGPLGGNALAHVRDFEYPVAAFDGPDPARATPAGWRITVKLAGRLFDYSQSHTPFDVVAWHGRYAPYRYTLSRFGHLTANTDQLDPTAYCVLTAPSRWPGVSLVDFCVFGEKWAVAPDAVRLPYYHRTVATEMVGIIKGAYKGSVRPLEEGGLSFEACYMPHGESYEAWKAQSERALGAERVGTGFLAFMFHITAHVGLTQWATAEHPDIRPDQEAFWDDFRADFWDRPVQNGNGTLARAGLPVLEAPKRESNGCIWKQRAIAKAPALADAQPPSMQEA